MSPIAYIQWYPVSDFAESMALVPESENVAGIDVFIGEAEWLYRGLGPVFMSKFLDDLVFASVEGKPLDPGVVSHNFHKIAARAGLKNVRFHDLRHTFASLMFLRGARPKVISEALGHASVGFTMDTYSHIIEGMQADAMALLDEVLPKGVVKNSVAFLSPTLALMSTRHGNLASAPVAQVDRAAVS